MRAQNFDGHVSRLAVITAIVGASACSSSSGEQVPGSGGAANETQSTSATTMTGSTGDGPTSSAAVDGGTSTGQQTASTGSGDTTNGDPGASGTVATTAAATGTTGAGTTGAGTTGGGGPVSCPEAAAPYTVARTPLTSSVMPSDGGLVVAAADTGAVYVGFNAGSAAIVTSNTGFEVSLPEATLGGVAATDDGVGVLLLGEMWAQVQRFDSAGAELFATDLFRSPNLDDVGTKGEARRGRLGYLAASDTLVAYFGHTQRYDDGVRHQGGYLALLDATGTQALLDGWFGSHNLDQRLWTGQSEGLVIGLGDAYPIGIFHAPLGDRPRPEVIYRLAAAGNGAANGQLGGIVELTDELIVPFITNLSVSPDVDAGEWPDIDDAVASQIREAAANGTDMGLLRVPKSGFAGEGDAPTVWLEPELTEGARLVRLKAARYGAGEMVLLVWAEATGGNRDAALTYYTMVVDASGAVCQPKTELEGGYAVSAGDDIVQGPNGVIHWANAEGGAALVSLTPG